MTDKKMERVSRDRPCPVCGHGDWCLVAVDGSAAICPRIKEGSLRKCGEAGYLHILQDRRNGHDRHRNRAKWRHTLIVVQRRDGRVPDFEQLSARFQSRLTSERLRALARSLGLSARGLQRLRVGWGGRAYTFPMASAAGKITGIRQRFPNGGKASIMGSKTGLFIPTDLTGMGPLLICEGVTDAAAALDLGFDAIGRPNCDSVVKMTVAATKDRTKIVVVADNDCAGRTGAEKLASELALCCPSVKIVMPPDGTKDLRQWLNIGLTSEALREIIADTCPIHMTVSFSLVQAGKGARR